MKIQYDSEIDALYIELREEYAVRSLDIEEGVSIDLDENNSIVGVEILDASEKLKSSLNSIEIVDLPPWKKNRLMDAFPTTTPIR